MPDIARALTIEAQLAAAIARRAPVRPPTLAKGMRLVASAHHRVESPTTKKIAADRAKLWAAFLAQRLPTHASVRLVTERLRAIALVRMTLVARVLGYPDPPGYHPPRRIERLLPRRHVTRADTPPPEPDPGFTPKPFDYTGPFNPDPLPNNLREQVDEAWSALDSLMADLRGEVTDGVSPNSPSPTLDTASQQAIKDSGALAEVGFALDFDSWLGLALNDLQVLQIVNSYWSGQAASAAAQDLFTAALGGKAAGISGVFDLTDPYMLNFLQRNAGYYITAIDNATRGQIMSTLWAGYGGLGPDISTMSIDELARTLYQTMQDYAAARPGAAGPLGISQYRANMIATTETARAETFGQFVSLLKTGARQKIWMITEGACIKCVGNNSMGAIPLFDPFPDGSMAPPSHPICRCSLASPLSTSFNPDDWSGGPDTAWFDQLASMPGIEQWPNVDLSGMQWDWGQGKTPPTPMMPTGGLIDRDYLPPGLDEMLTPEGIQALGQRFADAVDQWSYYPQETVSTATAEAPVADSAATLAEKMRQMFEDFYS